MKKIKGSLSAIRMSHLVALFAVMAVSGLAIRTYQLLVSMVNPTNGFFENANFTVPVLYGILAVGSVLFLLLSFLSKNVPAPKLPEGRNIPLGIASFLAAIGFVWDIIVVAKTVIPYDRYGAYTDIFGGLMNINIKGNGGIFVILQFVFAILSVFYFIVFGMSHFEGKATYKKVSLLSIAPGCWAMFMLISKLMKAISFITVSELLFEIGMLVFTMIFFLTFARIVSGVFSVNSMWCTYGCGFPAAIFAGLISVPRGIVLAVGRETVEGSDFSFTHLFLFVFITVYIISTLGVGFKNSLKKMRSVSNIVLPDDDEVVVKSSEAITPVLEVQETEQVENNEKKKGFSIAPEFKNLNDIGDFFDDEPENDVVEEIEQNVEVENIENDVLTEETEQLPVDEVVEMFEEIEEVQETEENNFCNTEIPVEDISFYQLEDLVNKTEDENTVTEAVEDYEEKVNEEINENPDEMDSQVDDFVTSEEDSQEIDTEPLEEITEISFEADGEDAREESTEEIPEEVIEEINEPDEDEFDFELTDIFGQKEVINEVPEVDEEPLFEEIVTETVEITETPQEVMGVSVEEIELPEETEVIIPEEPEKTSVKSTGGFLEFSKMLIDDFEDEDLTEDTVTEEKTIEESVEIPKIKEPEITEEVKPEKVKKEKIKKEKVKKEKVKKEKPQKAPKSFGKKKKTVEEEEPLTIVSLADMKNKKD